MTDRIIPASEWQAQEKYLRYRDHSHAALRGGDLDRALRYDARAVDARQQWQALIKERESK